MKEIALSNNRGIAFVSDDDFAALSAFKWHLHSAGYAYRAQKKGGKQTNYLMHREVMGSPAGMVVDHVNGNRLDNRRENLRIATVAENSRNKAAITGSSKLRGVSWHTSKGKWRAVIKIDRKARHVGYFATEAEAAAAYERAAKETFGAFARADGDA